MGLTDHTLLYEADSASCNVEPVVLFSIVDHYSRRDEGQDFVIGTLLGTEENGVVTICSSFPVPHTEVEDQIALNTDFHATMLALQLRVEPKQTVVGWYCTGEHVNENTTLFHQFYEEVRMRMWCRRLAVQRAGERSAGKRPAGSPCRCYHVRAPPPPDPPLAPSPALSSRGWRGQFTCCWISGLGSAE